MITSQIIMRTREMVSQLFQSRYRTRRQIPNRLFGGGNISVILSIDFFLLFFHNPLELHLLLPFQEISNSSFSFYALTSSCFEQTGLVRHSTSSRPHRICRLATSTASKFAGTNMSPAIRDWWSTADSICERPSNERIRLRTAGKVLLASCTFGTHSSLPPPSDPSLKIPVLLDLRIDKSHINWILKDMSRFQA